MKIVVILLVSTAVMLHTASQEIRPSGGCSPGQMWKEDCNNCFCSLNGEAICTRMACDPKVTRGYSTRCTPGTTWKVDCNTCFCTASGVTGCTRMACPPRDCTPGDSWSDGCNTCVCNDNGRASCTEKACIN